MGAMGVRCCPNIVLGARRPNGTAPLVGSFGWAQACMWVCACLREQPVAQMGPLLWSAPLVGLTCIWHWARLCESRLACHLCLAGAGVCEPRGWAGGPFPTFFLSVDSLLASMRATSFLSLALGWRLRLRATWVGGGPFSTLLRLRVLVRGRVRVRVRARVRVLVRARVRGVRV